MDRSRVQHRCLAGTLGSMGTVGPRGCHRTQRLFGYVETVLTVIDLISQGPPSTEHFLWHFGIRLGIFSSECLLKASAYSFFLQNSRISSGLQNSLKKSTQVNINTHILVLLVYVWTTLKQTSAFSVCPEHSDFVWSSLTCNWTYQLFVSVKLSLTLNDLFK